METERVGKIKNSIPNKMFFDPLFEKNGSEYQILKKIVLNKSKIQHENLLNCAPLLSKDQEYHLFRKYNYLKYRLLKLTVGFAKSEEKISPKPCPSVRLERLKEKSLQKIEKIIKDIDGLRNLLLTSNMRLVVRQISKYSPEDSFKRDEFLSNSYMHVIKAIECFDYRRGFKFSTYCVNVLKFNLKKDSIYLYKVQSPLENSSSLNLATAKKETFSEINSFYDKQIIKLIFKEIEKNTKNPQQNICILSDYFGLNGNGLRLEEIGKKLGLSRERVRQIKNQTIKLLQNAKICYDPLV